MQTWTQTHTKVYTIGPLTLKLKYQTGETPEVVQHDESRWWRNPDEQQFGIQCLCL
uniref:Uncharacterized protein n=1 Tax=Octopus bimaculoides TaxID=37653 RepID=A0A0L8HVL8_OCTBM